MILLPSDSDEHATFDKAHRVVAFPSPPRTAVYLVNAIYRLCWKPNRKSTSKLSRIDFWVLSVVATLNRWLKSWRESTPKFLVVILWWRILVTSRAVPEHLRLGFSNQSRWVKSMEPCFDQGCLIACNTGLRGLFRKNIPQSLVASCQLILQKKNDTY